MTVNPVPRPRVFLALRPYQIVLAHLVLEQEQAESTPPARVSLVCSYCGDNDADQRLIQHDAWDDVHYLPVPPSVLRAQHHIDSWAEQRFDRDHPVSAYVSNDTLYTSQLFVSYFRHRELVLMEDGIGSYVRYGWNNSLKRRLLRSTVYRPLFGSRYFNTGGLATTTAERYYALSDRAFPRIDPPTAARRQIRVRDSRYTLALRERMTPITQAAFGDRPVFLVLSEPLLGMDLPAFDVIMKLIAKNISDQAPPEAFVWFKRHPSESAEIIGAKTRKLRELLRDDLMVGDPAECTFPAELSSLLGIDVGGVFGVLSSALQNVRLLDPAVPVTAYHELLSHDLKSAYRDYIIVMNEAGVLSPVSEPAPTP